MVCSQSRHWNMRRQAPRFFLSSSLCCAVLFCAVVVRCFSSALASSLFALLSLPFHTYCTGYINQFLCLVVGCYMYAIKCRNEFTQNIQLSFFIFISIIFFLFGLFRSSLPVVIQHGSKCTQLTMDEFIRLQLRFNKSLIIRPLA